MVCFFHFFGQFPFASNWKHSNKQNGQNGRDCKNFISLAFDRLMSESARLLIPYFIFFSPLHSTIGWTWSKLIRADVCFCLIGLLSYFYEITSTRYVADNVVIYIRLDDYARKWEMLRARARAGVPCRMHVGMAWLEKWLEAISRVLTRRAVIDAVADSVELVV